MKKLMLIAMIFVLSGCATVNDIGKGMEVGAMGSDNIFGLIIVSTGILLQIGSSSTAPSTEDQPLAQENKELPPKGTMLIEPASTTKAASFGAAFV